MESNFSFLEPNYPEYYRLAVEAERNMIIAPRTAVMYARLTLEELIKWMYTYDEKLADKKPEKQTLEGLMYYAPFKALIADVPNLIDGLTLIRKNGNQALHNKNEVLLRYAHGSVHSLYEFAKWIYYTYVDSSVRLPLSLDTTLIPRESEAKETIASAKALESRLKSVKEEAERQLQQKEEELKRLRAEVSRMKAENQRKSTRAFTLNPATESETREILIDVMLRELGWQPEGKNVREYPVQGMPTKSGKGRVDYVLWGDNGLPLAVVEVKRSMEDPRKGKQQAKCYADCLEKQFGRRPLIFYSNGYDTYFWDDTEYPPRQVAGFFSKDELEWTIAKRMKKPLQEAKVNEEIAGRYYQIEALKRVAETFDARHRKALLVMATGTGKTRTAIALVEMMLKQGWARRILFLADRTALVIQAKNNFVNLQPNLSCVDITRENAGIQTAKMIFSTYPTMMNKIDSERINDLLVYSPAHFDLVIIDEAHRSVYRKYQAIFSYFDALLVGLTATPKSEVDKNTYELFDLENHNPTYAYELDKAVEDHYLVPPRRVEVTTRFLSEGIKYRELSEEEKREYEERFYDEATDSLPEEIDPAALNEFVFNKDTVDKVLNHLMTEGVKVEGGDKIGKTIIFAKNHKHAEVIVGRFYKLYPHLGGDFMQVIDNQQTYAQNLIDDFSNAEKMPQIAVSVDMLDTGIDIPEILNLVFFKIVRSSSKFWQMIGRGTRLCPGIFGLPADEKDTFMDKKEFLVFDYCQNFEFFDVHPEGIENRQPKSVSQRIMEARIRLAWHLQEMSHPDEQSEGLRNRLLDAVHRTVCGFNRNSFVVKAVLREVDIYSKREKWNTLFGEDLVVLFDKLTVLAEPEEEDEDARRFDLFMLNFMLALVHRENTYFYAGDLQNIAKSLLRNISLPEIRQHEQILRFLVSDQFEPEHLNVYFLEEVRMELRQLVRLLEKEKRKIVYSNFEDEMTQTQVSEAMPTYTRSPNYLQRVECYVRENQDYLVIQKLKRNIPVTTAELQKLEELLFDGKERGTKADFEKVYGDYPLGQFIRSIVGLEVGAAKAAFGEFLKNGNLSANQIHFIDMIIDFLSKEGVIAIDRLYGEPFTRLHTGGIGGLFTEQETEKIIAILTHINENAVA